VRETAQNSACARIEPRYSLAMYGGSCAILGSCSHMPRRLKVFRTATGFHDAYVAAPSQKAALEAWGSDADLFARGVAERVEDPELMKAPLARPGEVIRLSRGTAAEQIAALPPDKPKPAKAEVSKPRAKAKAGSSPPARDPKPKPRPSRADLDRAEQALEERARRQADERAELDRRLDMLQRERRELARRHERDVEALERALRAARTSYEEAMEAWRA